MVDDNVVSMADARGSAATDASVRLQRRVGQRLQSVTISAWRNLPATIAVSDSVLVQQRADPNPIRFATRRHVVESVAKLLNLSNVSSDNVGWFGQTPRGYRASFAAG